MALLIGFLTFVLVMNCLFLMLLILIQLPKKEAGAGMAFGGAAADALFGAGQGNALTKMTKYSASLFVGLSVVLSVMNMHEARAGSRRLEQEVQKQASTPAAPPKPAAPAPGLTLPTTPEAPTTSLPLPIAPNNSAAPSSIQLSSTSAPAAKAPAMTNAPAGPAK